MLYAAKKKGGVEGGVGAYFKKAAGEGTGKQTQQVVRMLPLQIPVESD